MLDRNPSKAAFNAALDLLEKLIRDLEIEYDKYFNGMERRPPINLRRQVLHLQRDIDNAVVTNTQLQFRARQINQRLVTYQNRWNRIMRQIEDGTYVRDKKRATQIAQARADQQEVEQAQGTEFVEIADELASSSFHSLAEELVATLDFLQVRQPSQAAAPPQAAQPSRPLRQTHSRISQSTDPQLRTTRPDLYQPDSGSLEQRTTKPNLATDRDRDLYNRFIEARRSCQQSVDNLTFDRIQQSMDSQRNALKKKTGQRNVDFDVVIKDGRAYLKPKTTE